MVQKTGGAVDATVQKHLQRLFGSEEAPDGASNPKTGGSTFPIQDLKAMILSIDWEITDAAMEGFLTKVAELRQGFKEDELLAYFLQLLWLIGRYIKVHKSQSHPQSIKALQATFSGLEKVVISPGLPEKEKKKILRLELDRYRRLKQTIAQQRHARRSIDAPAPAAPVVAAPPKAEIRDQATAPSLEGVASTAVPEPRSIDCPESQAASESALAGLEEIKQLIREEFKLLRTELKTWIQPS